MSFLEVNNVKKIYTSRFNSNKVEALTNISFSVEKDEFVAIMGESGSGKTTLLNILATLDSATSGEIKLNGANITSISERDIVAFRREKLGFVFQDFNLLNTFSNKDNVLLPLVLAKKSVNKMQEALLPLLNSLDIAHLQDKFPYEISGGQKQRVAIARALISNPDIILADEPTGALDSKSSDQILNLFKDINKAGQCILMVTHSIKAASMANRILFIKDGEVYHQLYRGSMNNDELYNTISNTLSSISTQGNTYE